MQFYSCFSAPFRVYGLDVVDTEKQNYWRLADEDSALVSEGVRKRSKAPSGGRVRFRTDADSVHVKLRFHEIHVDWGASVCAGESVCVLTGSGLQSQYRGVVCAEDYSPLCIEKTIRLRNSDEEKRLRQVTIHLPFGKSRDRSGGSNRRCSIPRQTHRSRILHSQNRHFHLRLSARFDRFAK